MSEEDSGSLHDSSSGMLGHGNMSHRSDPIAIGAYGERSLCDGAIPCVMLMLGSRRCCDFINSSIFIE